MFKAMLAESICEAIFDVNPLNASRGNFYLFFFIFQIK